jgi:MFS transporter, MHS family, alpha-ketoglutarate permease
MMGPVEDAVSTPAAEEAPPRGRVVVASTAGIFVEAFDWTVYGLMAPYFAEQIFPGADRVTKVLAAYVVFAAGFLARPIGGAVMGRITDVRGRRTGLMYSVLLIAAGSLVLALVPTHAQIGWLAAVVVFAARILQGIAMGGEIATAATYVVEVAPVRRRHTYGAIAYSGDALGSLGAAAVLAVLLALLGKEGVTGGGWRLAFVVGALLGLLGWWIRRGVPESQVFRKAAEHRQPAGPLLRANRARMLLVFAMTIGSTVGVYFGTVYLPQFGAHAGGISEEQATAQLTVALVVLLVSMIGAGVLSDRFGPLALIRAGFTLLAVTTAPLMVGVIAGAVPFVVAACVFCLGLGLQLGVTPVAGARLFPVPIRALALGVPASVAIAVFGGTLPFVAEWLADRDHLGLVVGYVTLTVAMSAVGAWLLRYSLLYDDTDAELAGRPAEATQ